MLLGTPLALLGPLRRKKAIPVAVRGKLIGRSGNFAAQCGPPDFFHNLFVLTTRPNWLEWCRISMSALRPHFQPGFQTPNSFDRTLPEFSYVKSCAAGCEQRSWFTARVLRLAEHKSI